MIRIEHQKLAIAACVTLLVATPSSGAEYCNSILNSGSFAARQLVDRSSLAIMGNNELRRPPASGNLNLGYVIPSYPWNSGALVVKVRHKIAGNSTNSNPVPSTLISLYREAHLTPCSRTIKSKYSKQRDTVDYINYHRYKSYDGDFDEFHTEIGSRPASVFGFDTTRCRSTRTDYVRSQLLFEDDPAIRRAPVKVQVARNLSQNVQVEINSITGKPVAAQTIPNGYKEYVDLKTMIVPYRKMSDQPACVGIMVNVPPHAVETEIMAVNSDDALVYSQDQDPQGNWHISWQR
jgi:hypothetical protein